MTTLYKCFIFLGLGGGWRTPLDIGFFASFFMPDARIVLIDGGRHDSRQLDHEHFLVPGNKARVQADFLQREFPELSVEHHPRYLGPEASEITVAPHPIMTPGSVVFIQVDNNKTRRLITDHAQTLDDVTLLCGGTNGDQIRILVHLRRNGRDLTPPFTEYCPAIANPTDKAPFDVERENCTDRLGTRERFHPFTMMATSTLLANAFYEVWRRENAGMLGAFPYDELWYDIRTGRSRTEQYTRREEVTHGHDCARR